MVRGDHHEADVLLVEDDPALSHMYRLKLVAEGFSVRIAADGPSGLAAALRRLPDVLLLDIRLPGFDGFELLVRFRREAPDARVPVIVLTNYGVPETIERSLALGVAEHVVKSQTSPSSLVEIIRRHLLAEALSRP